MHARSGRAREISLPSGTVWFAAVAVIALAAVAGAFGHRAFIAPTDASPAPAAGTLSQTIAGNALAIADTPVGGASLANVPAPVSTAAAPVSGSPTLANAAAVSGLPLTGSTPNSQEVAERANVVGLLAERVGALQARMATLESTSERLSNTGLLGDEDLLTDNPGRSSGDVDASGAANVDASGAAKNLAGPAMGARALPMSWSDFAGSASKGAAASVGTSAADRVAPDASAQDLAFALDRLQALMGHYEDVLSAYDDAFTRRAAEHARMPSYMPVTDFLYLSSSYGWRRHPVTGRTTMHEGLDFAAPRGTPIYASAAGIVVEAKYLNGYGNTVEIEHGNGIVTRYAHSSQLHVRQGDLVERGQLIADVGSSGRSTGPHLHFEVRMAGQPLDPRLFLVDQAPAGSTIVRADHEGGLSP